MPADLALAFDPADAALGREVAAALGNAGFAVAPWTESQPPAGVRIGVALVTRRYAVSPALNSRIDAASRAGLRTLLAWWSEDAPSDALSEHAVEDTVFYACFLPREQRVPGLVERLRAELRPA